MRHHNCCLFACLYPAKSDSQAADDRQTPCSSAGPSTACIAYDHNLRFYQACHRSRGRNRAANLHNCNLYLPNSQRLSTAHQGEPNPHKENHRGSHHPNPQIPQKAVVVVRPRCAGSGVTGCPRHRLAFWHGLFLEVPATAISRALHLNPARRPSFFPPICTGAVCLVCCTVRSCETPLAGPGKNTHTHRTPAKLQQKRLCRERLSEEGLLSEEGRKE